jgi:hypothetical protein
MFYGVGEFDFELCNSTKCLVGVLYRALIGGLLSLFFKTFGVDWFEFLLGSIYNLSESEFFYFDCSFGYYILSVFWASSLIGLSSDLLAFYFGEDFDQENIDFFFF